MAIQTPGAPGKPGQKPNLPPGAKPKKKLSLDINDVQAVLERKISP